MKPAAGRRCRVKPEPPEVLSKKGKCPHFSPKQRWNRWQSRSLFQGRGRSAGSRHLGSRPQPHRAACGAVHR